MYPDNAIRTTRARQTKSSPNPVPAPGRKLQWPTLGAFKTYMIYGIVIDALFFVVYGGANWLAVQRADHFRLYFEWELGIPFLPWLILAYLSMLVLFLFPLFQLEERDMPRLAKQVMAGTTIAGLLFILFPAELGFPRVGGQGVFGVIYEFIYSVDFPHNLAPALHVVFSALVVASLMEGATRVLRLFYASWLIAITFSVVLVHQHHLIDVVTGFILAWFCRRLFRAPAAEALTL